MWPSIDLIDLMYRINNDQFLKIMKNVNNRRCVRRWGLHAAGANPSFADLNGLNANFANQAINRCLDSVASVGRIAGNCIENFVQRDWRFQQAPKRATGKGSRKATMLPPDEETDDSVFTLR
jgi:hypothetical protein